MKKISPQKSWEVFNQLAPNYDRTNRILSMGIDRLWRKKMLSFIPKNSNLSWIDLASGTGDLLVAILEARSKIESVVALDLAQKMLLIAEKKLLSKNYFFKIKFKVGSALAIPEKDKVFNLVTMSFGIRNTGNIEKTLQEIYRVLKKNGKVLILEFSIPRNFFFKIIYLFYFRYLLPLLGGLLTKNFSAYYYLNKSVENFPCVSEFKRLMYKNGFQQCRAIPLSWGICTMYLGKKLES